MGPQRSGKSSLGAILRDLLGQSSISYVTLKSLRNSQFTHLLEHSMLNIEDDIGSCENPVFLGSWENVKKMTQDLADIEINQKFLQPYHTRTTSQQLIISNNFVRFLAPREAEDSSF